ncbi:hypothetical protein A3K48_05560 [candidate division WOR-1 bacterium RIFOXYA12_FULL_52_29]|uniref:DUF4149 domain-containing protein n=1 Tax=candidate division WOR-1 bacterium RIFOXYC12_FULL_54_18 TaxID=1802584 RepID=A0A1F4T6K9_UNCSA|nr:MAG: hypothetical protein A3K44_05560 [candidate division WOR-1 bacterium RIFOXYA2_FULL_51_19]OGC18004.1 MAG: hypothetical protein A3K48_05560 [candidate division WOR-1 bacterium RIFOXYA12_FULL_52_29]OGC26860.1 MAG: hypothetical protein A3K32_05555 [candidate division WOR-1 bacterium RIFOXYB2_FULL_45_9]OGC28421.1 MAG: hypothetical protein A3K49_05560 [candidate division WOR-1 bacterium RIFOXYC12_FULL_54_18]OGC31124.1 MAG: hypothetical protein A2346_07060 [candidate division WOR-1 bacterium R
MDPKKFYYYSIAFVSLFILLWGAADLANTLIGSFYRAPMPSAEQGMAPDGMMSEQNLDVYYQRKMLLDRYSDSLIRLIVGGVVFLYAKKQADELEKS